MRVKICRVQDLDLHIAVKMNAGQSGPWVDFAMVFLHECLMQRLAVWQDFHNIFDALGKAAQRHGQSRKINTFMEELKKATTAIQQQQPQQQQPQQQPQQPNSGAPTSSDEQQQQQQQQQQSGAQQKSTELVTHLMERWIRIWTDAGGQEQKCVHFIPLLQQQNILKTDEMTEIFLRIAMELCVNAFFKSLAATEGTGADGQPNQPSTQYASMLSMPSPVCSSFWLNTRLQIRRVSRRVCSF